MEILKFFGVDKYNEDELNEFKKWFEKARNTCGPIYKQLKGALKSENLVNFLNYLTELNIYRRLSRFEHKLECEPDDAKWADIRFGKIHISIKNLHPKKYTRDENEIVGTLQKNEEKNVPPYPTSDVELKRDASGIEHRTEIGNGSKSYLHSDLAEMTPVISEIGKLEGKQCDGKRILIYFIQRGGMFDVEHAKDICGWYYRKNMKNRIFKHEPRLYFKSLGKKRRERNIDAIIFLWQEKNYVLDWPEEFPSLTPIGLHPPTIYADGDPKLCETLVQQLLP